jgi:hypothetical protein
MKAKIRLPAVMAMFWVLAIAAAPARAADSAVNTCEAGIEKLDVSTAEGDERLTEKNGVLDRCAKAYARDKTSERLVKECTRYEAQAASAQQLAADCQLAAYRYVNALRLLKAQ